MFNRRRTKPDICRTKPDIRRTKPYIHELVRTGVMRAHQGCPFFYDEPEYRAPCSYFSEKRTG